MKLVRKFLLEFSLTIFVIASVKGSIGELAAAEGQRLSREQALEAVTSYAIQNRLIRGSQSVKSISFNPETGRWLVLFGSDQDGNGHFGASVSDVDSTDIIIQKGL